MSGPNTGHPTVRIVNRVAEDEAVFLRLGWSKALRSITLLTDVSTTSNVPSSIDNFEWKGPRVG